MPTGGAINQDKALSTYLLLGSNADDAVEQIANARKAIILQVGTQLNESSLYKTEAWGMRNQPDFVNQLVIISFTGTPLMLLDKLQGIESAMGRQRTTKWGPRIIDIDILFMDDMVVHEDLLTVPHPYIAQRRFALAPLAEIAGQFIHPTLNKNMSQLLLECIDPLSVEIIK